MTLLAIPDAALAQHIRLGPAPSITVPTDIDRAYAAGFFDGEGSITIATNHNVSGARGVIYNMRVGASQNEIEPLAWLRDRWGGSIKPVKRKTATGNTTHIWWCFGLQAAAFLRDVLPFLKVKRERADLAIRFQGSKFNPGARGHTAEYRSMLGAMKDKMRRLNSHKSAATRVIEARP